MLSENQKSKIKSAFQKGTLETQSLSPSGKIEWKAIEKVHRVEAEWEEGIEVSTSKGSSIMTAGHRIYTSPTTKEEADSLAQGQGVEVKTGSWNFLAPVSTKKASSRKYWYDLTVADNHNLFLENSGICVSNCPDRNYHFRPPTSEGTINEFNRVFSYIWTDEELVEYMLGAVDYINMWPPRTGFRDIEQMIQARPSWREMIMYGAMAHAAMALTFNWVADEFDYSIGGVSLSIEKSSKYESLKSNAEGQFKEMLSDGKSRTEKYIRGLKQSRYGVGVRSAFGPVTGKGVLTPRKYLGVSI